MRLFPATARQRLVVAVTAAALGVCVVTTPLAPTHAWADIKPVVEATGRRVLVIAGIWTEVCLAQTVLAAIADGYTVFFVSDCSGGVSLEAHEDGKRRMVQAGASGINWVAVCTEWAPDFTTPERDAVIPAIAGRGGAVGLSIQYLVANIPVPELA